MRTISSRLIAGFCSPQFYSEEVGAFTVNVKHGDLAKLSEGFADWAAQLADGTIEVQGDQEKFTEFAGLF